MHHSIFVHPTAVVDDGAQVGEDTKIWHFSHLMPGCTVGSYCHMGQNVFIDRNVSIGNGVKIQNNVSVYNGVMIEDEVFIGPSVVFTNVINPRSFIERKHEFKPTMVRKGATIGANATIVCGIEIGEYALIGAGSVVTHSVKPYALVYGNPAVQQGWVSRAGCPLHFNENAQAFCNQSNEWYRLQDGAVRPVV